VNQGGDTAFKATGEAMDALWDLLNQQIQSE